jgi:hypothetical protein
MKDKISPYQGILQATHPDFFQEISTLESLLSFDCNIELIKNLTHLYTEAIEHFESLRDPRYSIYFQKLKNLLRKPEVRTLFDLEPVPEPKRPARKELSCERVIEKTLQTLHSENSLVSCRIQENLKEQNINFQKKLASRKRKSKQTAKFKAIEEGIEEIIEGFVEQKGKCIKAVQEKYSESLKELKNMQQNEVVKKVLQEIERQMNEEVIQKVEEIENCKKKQMQCLKKKVQLQIG